MRCLQRRNETDRILAHRLAVEFREILVGLGAGILLGGLMGSGVLLLSMVTG